MRKLYALILSFILIFTFTGISSAVVQGPTGTIALVPGQTPTYQQTVWFDWSVSGKLKGYQYPMILVKCFQPDNPDAYDENGGVYAMLERPFASPFETYKLGGGSSVWVLSGGGNASCEAHIMIYNGLHSGPILDLGVTTFEVKG